MKLTLLLFVCVAVSSVQARDYAKLPRDRPLHVSSTRQATALERAAQPYIEKARRTYPAARKRFLAGLPQRYLFAVTTKLWDRSHTKFEVVFVVVQQIKGGKIRGHVANQTRLPIGYKFGDSISLPESEIMDWTIVRPDGTEEGNVVGKFLEKQSRR